MTINGRWKDIPIDPVKPGTNHTVSTAERETEPFASALRVSLASTKTGVIDNAADNETTPTSGEEQGTQTEPASGSGESADSGDTTVYGDPYDGRYGDGVVRFVNSRGELCDGYYGMDSDGHWGYYYDAARTQKIPNSGWEEIKASDGGRALFTLQNGSLWPAMERDESRAGQIVTLVAGRRAFEVKYDENGYVRTVINISQTRGINGHDLDLPVARSQDDRGVGGSELMPLTDMGRDEEGVPMPHRAAEYTDWENALLARTAEYYAQTEGVYVGGSSYGSAEGHAAAAQTAQSAASAQTAAAVRAAAAKTASPLVELADTERAVFEARPLKAPEPSDAHSVMRNVRIARGSRFDASILDLGEDDDKD